MEFTSMDDMLKAYAFDANVLELIENAYNLGSAAGYESGYEDCKYDNDLED